MTAPGWVVAVAVWLVAAGGSAAGAAPCEEALAVFAAETGLTVVTDPPRSPPVFPPDAGSSVPGLGPQDLGRTGGVIVPPPSDDRAVIEPPPMDHRMPTTPPVGAERPPGPIPDPLPPGSDLAPETRMQAQALVESALAAARAEDQQQCFERLGQAMDLLRRAGRGGPG